MFLIKMRHEKFRGVSGEKQEEVKITPEKIKKVTRKMSNWKAPGPDSVQGFWLKNFKSF